MGDKTIPEPREASVPLTQFPATVTQLSAVDTMNQQHITHTAVSKRKREEEEDKLVRSSRNPAKPAGSQMKSGDWFPADTGLTVPPYPPHPPSLLTEALTREVLSKRQQSALLLPYFYW